MLEKQIEKSVCDYAKERGFLVDKFSSPGKRSVPDRLLTHPSGYMFFIEFKREGKMPTELQKRDHTLRRGHNVAVYIVDHIDHGKYIIDLVCDTCPR